MEVSRTGETNQSSLGIPNHLHRHDIGKKTQMKIMKSIKDLMGVPENCLHVGCSFCVRQPVFDSFRSIYLFL